MILLALWLDGMMSGPISVVLMPLHVMNALLLSGAVSVTLPIKGTLVDRVGQVPGLLSFLSDRGGVRLRLVILLPREI
jgi:hypothetical protein